MIRTKEVLFGRHAIVFAIVLVGLGLIACSLAQGLAGIAFFDSLFLIGAAFPLVLSFVVQIVICRYNKIPFRLVFSSPDMFVLLLSPLIWSYAITLSDPKGLSNLLEVPLLGFAWGICITIRTFLVLRNHPRSIWFGSWITVILTIAITALVGIFYPSLPE